MAENAHHSRRHAVDADDPVVTIHRASEPPVVLHVNEYRLALLGLVDFDGDWEALLAAAAFVVDGEKKSALIRERLLPVAADLPELLSRTLDGLELLAARHWFRNGQV